MTRSDERLLSLLKDARDKLQSERRLRTEPLAIVGMGCRFPGGASSPAAFWEMLESGVDATREVPSDRWDAEAIFDADPATPGKSYVKRGGFLDAIDGFEPEFFGISPREAIGLDPQQRLLLEVTWEALEDAGIVPERLRGSRTGVWVGLTLDDYAGRTLASGDLTRIDAYSALGGARSVAAGRIAYVLDLRGPVMQLDAACASSLVAVHLACQSLRAGECDLALVGAANLMSSPEATVALCKLRALAPDGRSKTFDAAADGYGRGEGCGIVVLRRLSDAQAAGDRIHAIIRGSAVNHDGRSNGLTAPNGIAQEEVIRGALDNAALEPSKVGYVEAHGTGTLLGDPIEVLALSRVYRPDRSVDRPLYVGSVKTNFGHLEAAAGIAGLIKTALCLTHQRIAPHLHVRELNPKIPWRDLGVRVTMESTEWPRQGGSRVAGVSAFGFSGTNAHVLVEEAPAVTETKAAPARSGELVLVSARTDAGLRASAARLREAIENHPEWTLADLAYSLVTTRSRMEHRLACVVPTREALSDILDAVARGETPVGAVVAQVRESSRKIAWVFTGQGAQRLGMGRALYREWAAFRDALDAAFAVLDEHLQKPLREIMWAEPGSPDAALLDQTAYTQPALFAYGWALAALWRSWGVLPDALAGHFIGEVTAACVAGVFSLPDAARLVCARGRLMQALPAGGAMVAIVASEADVARALDAHRGTLALAAVNAPSSVVISGNQLAVMAVAEQFSAKGVDVKRLTVSHAFHSPHMDPMLAAFREVARSIDYRPPSIALISGLTGQLTGPELASADYWVRHVREPVRFADAAKALHTAGAQAFLEVGPRPTLLPLVAASLPDHTPLLLASARPGRPEPAAVLDALALWVAHGGSFDAKTLFPDPGLRLKLPTYAWQRQRFWIENRIPSALPAAHEERDASPFCRLAWPEVGATSSALPATGHWAVVAVGDPANAEALAEQLRAKGASCARVDIADLGELEAAHLVCAWEARGNAPEAIHAAQQALTVVQALGRDKKAPRLWWVTRGAVAVGPEEDVSVASATIWGLGRTVMQEHPEFRCTLFDVGFDDPAAELLVHEASLDDDESELAWRAGKRHAARLVAAPASASSSIPVRVEGTVLITGGLGALGLEVARSLTERGVRHLLLTGRRGIDTPGAARAVITLQGLGARVTVAAVDVADAQALAQVLAAVPPEWPLRGVVHAAGLVDDGVLTEQTPERFARVMAPKVSGAWNLHTLTEHADLDQFILFSSMAGTLGSAGQSGYSAANAFLDSLAQHRRTRGLPALSLAWGPWAERGLAASLDDKMQARFARQGVRMITPAEGRALFDAALARPEAQLMIAPLDLRVLARAYAGAVPPLWRGLVRAPSPPAAGSKGTWARELAALPQDQRADAVTRVVRAEVARVLSFSNPADVPLDKALKDLGLDSLMAVELRNVLAKRSGATFPASLVFDHPTPDAIAKYLLTDVLSVADHVPAASTSLAVVVDEPIAIVGMGCRFPGGVTDPESFWRLLDQGVDAISEVPEDRWDVDAWYDPDPNARGKMTTRWGGFLQDLDQFEPTFFGLSPREAPSVDPQERLLLETTWEALERAGLRPESLMGSQTGVYMGLSGTEYQTRAMADVGSSDPYAMLGTTHSTMVGRLSYWLGLKGPNLPVDTACSSSLVAVHLACQALRGGECTLALAGGANVVLRPEGTVFLSRLHALSPTGRCRTFSADADGYVRSEGAGVVVLERLSDARRNGHPVLALLRGTSVNQDGRSNGLTAPNGPSQQALIREALRRGGIAPAQVDYVECHGTGTPLGDPIEVQALAAVLGEGRAADHPVVLGSVKSNLGHMEAAAGIGGLIKAVLTLQHARIPKTLHFTSPNPHIAWSELPVKVAAEATDWARYGARRIAGVSAFGISGTNAHVLVEEAPDAEALAPTPARSAELIVLSARTEDALRASAVRLRDTLGAHPDWTLADVANNLATTRSWMEHRLACAVPTRLALTEVLDALGQGAIPREVVIAQARESLGKPAWIFTGQGPQTLGMGKNLYGEWPVFRDALDAAFAALDPHLEKPLRDVMWADPASPDAVLLDQTAFTQPALFAYGWALAALWRSWGLVPGALAGHSIGEITAAAVAGVLSLPDAARLVAARGRLMQALAQTGAMAAIAAAEADVAAAILRDGRVLAIAAVNAPCSVVISGDQLAVMAVAEQFSAKGVDVKRLTVSHAFHSPHMDPMLAAFREVARSIDYRPPSIALISGLTGQLTGPELASADYWVRHVREPVRFADAAKALHACGVQAFLELGPKAILLPLVAASLPDHAPLLLASARPGRPEPLAILDALAAWVAHGGHFDSKAFFRDASRRLELPTYPWQKQRFWIDETSSPREAIGTQSRHPLLGRRVPSAGSDAVYESVLSVREPSWLNEHRVGSLAVVPGAALAELLRAAGDDLRHGAPSQVTGLLIRAPLIVSEQGGRRMQVVLTEGGARASVYSQAADAAAETGWTLHATAGISEAPESTPSPLDVAAARSRCTEPVDVQALYATFAQVGLVYGPAFQGLRALWRGAEEVLAEVELPPNLAADRFGVHPALLDAAMQAIAGVSDAHTRGPLLPFELAKFIVYQTGRSSVLAHVRPSEPATADDLVADVTLTDASGDIVARASGLHLRRADIGMFGPERSAVRGTDALYRLEWRQTTMPTAVATNASWAVVQIGDTTGAEALVADLRHSGAHCDLVQPGQLHAVAAEHVVCIWDPRGDAQGALRAAQQALVVAQNLIGRRDGPRLWWVTRGTVAVSADEDVAIGSSTLWGLGRTLMDEHPELRCTLLDVEPMVRLGDILLREACGADDERQLAWRGGQRHVIRLARAPVLPPRDGAALREGTILITGGLGALGLEAARALAQRGARHFLLAGRRGLHSENARALAEVEGLGAHVTVAALDVADIEMLARVLAAIPRERPLRGVVHAAGVVDDGLLSDQSSARFARVMAPKVLGAWNLHSLTEHANLDFFVLFSSMAGMLGSGGQSGYAAANAFLDSLAQHRHARKLPALSIAWGPWAQRGLAASLDATLQARLSRRGIGMIAPDRGRALFGALLRRPEASIMAAPLNLDMLKRYPARLPSVWRELVPSPLARATAAVESSAAELAVLPHDQRAEAIAHAVRTEAARVLSFADPGAVPLDQALDEIGLDSLMSVELRNALSLRLNVTLPASAFAQKPTLRSMATRVLAHLSTIGPEGQERPANGAFCETLASTPHAHARIFCFHDAGGSSSMFIPFGRLATEGIDVHAISTERSLGQSASHAKRYLGDVIGYVKALSDRPYVLFGHSLGSMLAWRVLQELADEGAKLPMLFVPSASALFDASGARLDEDPERAFALVSGGRTESARNLKTAFIADLSLFRAMPRRDDLPLDVPIAAFVGRDDHVSDQETMKTWAGMTRGTFSIKVFPGGHFYLGDEESRRLVIDELARRIR